MTVCLFLSFFVPSDAKDQSDKTPCTHVSPVSLIFPCNAFSNSRSRVVPRRNHPHCWHRTTSIYYLSFVLLYGNVAPQVTLLNDKFFETSSVFPLQEIVIFDVMKSTIDANRTSSQEMTHCHPPIIRRSSCRALRLDDVCHLVYVRVGDDRVLSSDLCLSDSIFTFNEEDDGCQDMKFQLAYNVLMKMDLTQHSQNWRPQQLFVTDVCITEHSSLVIDVQEILSFASQLKGGRRIIVIGGTFFCRARTEWNEEVDAWVQYCWFWSRRVY